MYCYIFRLFHLKCNYVVCKYKYKIRQNCFTHGCPNFRKFLCYFSSKHQSGLRFFVQLSPVYLCASHIPCCRIPPNPSHAFSIPNNGAVDRCNANVSTNCVRPISRSAQPKFRDENIPGPECGPTRSSQLAAGNSRVTESPFTHVERRPRKGRSEKNSNRRRAGTNFTRPRHKVRGSSIHKDIPGRMGAQSSASSTRVSFFG